MRMCPLRADGSVISAEIIHITDPCLGWEKTEQLIFDIADKL